MVNELLQWLVLVVVLLALLGVLRQVSLMLPARARAAPSGPQIGSRIDRRLLDELTALLQPATRRRGAILAFVTEQCTGCQHLLASIPNINGQLGDLPLVLVARSPSDAFQAAISETGIPFIIDVDGRLWRATKVTATPLVVKVDASGRVQWKEVTHRVDLAADTIIPSVSR
jgi:hypothetical protein